MRKTYIVTLSSEERADLEKLANSGRTSARRQIHARILLKADTSTAGPGWLDARISEALEISVASVARVRKRFVEEGLEAALNRRAPRQPPRRLLDGEQEAHLLAIACSHPPEGHARWTLRLLADQMVTLEYVEAISHETVRQALKKTRSSRT